MVCHRDPASAEDEAAASEDDVTTACAKEGKEDADEKVQGGSVPPSVRNLPATFWRCGKSSGRSVVGEGRYGWLTWE